MILCDTVSQSWIVKGIVICGSMNTKQEIKQSIK